jgi:hypothetical protein
MTPEKEMKTNLSFPISEYRKKDSNLKPSHGFFVPGQGCKALAKV